MARFFVFFSTIFLLTVYLCSFNPGKASATGGAFPFTKHGATAPGQNNTQDGGVDRSTTGQWPPGSEAGKYGKGECTNCHEPHASWGGSEPYPNLSNQPTFMTPTQAEGPDPYLAFSNSFGTEISNQNERAGFCWTCHETFNLNGNPPGWGYYGFYQGRDIFNGSMGTQPHSFLGAGNFQWPGEPPGGGASTIHARDPRPTSNYSAQCLNCHTPHGIKAADAAGAYDTFAVPASRQTVASGNPAVTADYLIPHQLNAWEEALCENCHDSNGPAGADIQWEINKRSLPGGSGHPVDDTALAGRHFVGEAHPVTVKHVECYDCHNPHAEWGLGGMKQSTGTADPVSGKLQGMRYIDINGNPQEPYPKGVRQPYIHEVCFKCHGDSYNQVFAGNAYPDDTTSRPDGRSNKRLEFDPNSSDGAYGPPQSFNSAYHPVSSPGRNTSLALCLQLENAFNNGPQGTVLDCSSAAAAKSSLQNLTINCTDCHNSDTVSGVAGPTTKSHLRLTDVASAVNTPTTGPHGSQILTPSLNFNSGVSDNGDRSILRDYYFTGTLPTDRRPFNSPSSTTEFQNRFKLCFNCHDWNTFYGNNDNTNFYAGGGGMGGGGMGNLHSLHLRGTGGMMWGPTYEACMICHYNIHSNVQATNTQYSGGSGTLPPDGDTHLINFAPGVVTGYNFPKPTFRYSSGQMSCNLRCHGQVMTYSYSCSHSLSNGTTDTCNDN